LLSAGGMNSAQDQRAFEALAGQIIEPVRRYLARRTDPATAADVLSEALLVLWRRLEDVPLEAPLPYAYTVARNCLHNAQRSAVRQQRLAERIAVIGPPTDAVPAHHDRRDEQVGSWGGGGGGRAARHHLLVGSLSGGGAPVGLGAAEPGADRPRGGLQRERRQHPVAPGQEAARGVPDGGPGTDLTIHGPTATAWRTTGRASPQG